MSDPRPKPILPKTALLFIIVGVAALFIIFVLMATIGDDVPTELPAPTQTSSGE